MFNNYQGDLWGTGPSYPLGTVGIVPRAYKLYIRAYESPNEVLKIVNSSFDQKIEK